MKAGKLIKDYLKQIFQKSHVITGVILAFLLGSALLYAGQLTNSLITFYEGSTASATDVNYNFELLTSAVDKDQEGLVCEMNGGTMINATAFAFVCDTLLAGDASHSGANLSFTPAEDGVFQIHKHIIVSGMVDSSYTTIYIGGTPASDSWREYFSVSSTQAIEISLEDAGVSGSSMDAGSYVLVKRIF
jgi:hypothetical protein